MLNTRSKNEDAKEAGPVTPRVKMDRIPQRGKFKHAKKHSLLFSTANPVKGVMVFCQQNREDRAVSEVIPFLNQYAAKFYPAAAVEKVEEEKKVEEGEAVTHKFPKRFSIVDTGSKGILFVSIDDAQIPPIEFVQKILTDADLPAWKDKSEHISRLVPAEMVVQATQEEVTRAAKEVLKPWLDRKKAGDKAINTFAVQFKSRNNSTIVKETCIDAVGDLIGSSLTVNLSKPDLSVIVEVFKSSCAVSAVTQYMELQRGNIHSIIEQKEGTKKEVKKEVKKVVQVKEAVQVSRPAKRTRR